jgi:hypothetical protein
VALRDLEQRAEAAVRAIAHLQLGLGIRVGVARLREEELAEPRARAEHAVLGPLERRALTLGELVGVEGREPVRGRVMDGDPRGIEHLAVGVQVEHVLRNDVDVGVGIVEDDRAGMRERLHGQDLQLAAVTQIAEVLRYEAIDEAVGLARDLVDGPRRSAGVLDQPQVAFGIRLDALVAGATEDAREVFEGGRHVERALPHPALGPFSNVNNRRCDHGYHVEPSNTGSGAPEVSVVAISVTRWATSASRLIRVT